MSNPLASATARKPLDGSWNAPLTVVAVVIVTSALSSAGPVHLSPPRPLIVVPSAAVYVHVASLMPLLTLNDPPSRPQPNVDLTVSDPPPLSVCAPSTVVVAGAAFVRLKKSRAEGSSGKLSPASMVLQSLPSKRCSPSCPLASMPASTSRPLELIVAL